MDLVSAVHTSPARDIDRQILRTLESSTFVEVPESSRNLFLLGLASLSSRGCSLERTWPSVLPDSLQAVVASGCRPMEWCTVHRVRLLCFAEITLLRSRRAVRPGSSGPPRLGTAYRYVVCSQLFRVARLHPRPAVSAFRGVVVESGRCGLFRSSPSLNCSRQEPRWFDVPRRV